MSSDEHDHAAQEVRHLEKELSKSRKGKAKEVSFIHVLNGSLHAASRPVTQVLDSCGDLPKLLFSHRIH